MNLLTHYEPAVKGEVAITNLTDSAGFDIIQRLTGLDDRNMKALKELYYSCGCHVTYQDALYGNIEMKEIY